MVGALDAGIGPIKARARGVSGGQLLVGLASGQLVGEDCLAGMDRVRQDAGSVLLELAPDAASTTAGRLAACSARTGWPGSRPAWLRSTADG